MAKIGPKEAQRIALREAKAKPRKGVVRHTVKLSTNTGKPRADKATPQATVEAPGASASNGQMIVVPELGALPADEVRRAVVQYRKHREKSRIAVAAYDKREREKRKREGK